MLLTMVLRIICLQRYNLPKPEILVILVQPSSGFLSQVRKEVVAGKNGREGEKETGGLRLSEKHSH